MRLENTYKLLSISGLVLSKHAPACIDVNRALPLESYSGVVVTLFVVGVEEGAQGLSNRALSLESYPGVVVMLFVVAVEEEGGRS